MRRYYHSGNTVRIVSATQPTAKFRRLRVAWFTLGSVFGLALYASLTGFIADTSVSSAAVASTNAQTLDTSDYAATETETHTDESTANVYHDQSLDLAANEHEPATPLYPANVTLKVGSGDTLINMLTDTGVSYVEAHAAVEAMKKSFNPKRLAAGQEMDLELDASAENPDVPTIRRLALPLSQIATLEVIKEGEGFTVKKNEAELYKRLVKREGDIEGSFYQTCAKLGIPAGAIAELMRAYSYDVDFQRDIHPGHAVEVLMERHETAEGISAGDTGVLYANLELGSRTIPVYRYTDKTGFMDYYNEKGESLRKALLRTPINGARITSGFGMRKHPILGYSKMHRGMDFGARTGTPIYAAGDGVIEYAGYKGSYGKYVRIQHNSKYSTAYAHASKIASGIRPGKRVKQGDVIAYVGTTGRSTGPHLHYEVMAWGKQVNPSKVKFKTGRTLNGTELAEFKKTIQEVKLALSNLEEKRLAMADPKPAE